MSPLAFHRKIYTPVRINPPFLTYITQPQDPGPISYNGSATLTGIATVNYLVSGIGTIGYEWIDNTGVIGVGTNLVLTNMTDSAYNGKVIRQQAIFYPDSTRVGIETFQPGASNSPLLSNSVTLNVRGQITISSQPSGEGGEDYGGSGLLDVSPATPNGTTTIDITNSDFSNFASDQTYTLIPRSTFVAKLNLNGAKGGGSTGGRGGNVVGEIVFEVGKEYKLVVGKSGGVNGTTGAGGGGRATAGGNSGGGFTGLFVSSISQANSILIAAGGGGAAESDYRPGGDGGGLSGGSPWTNAGGTQTSGGLGFYGNGPSDSTYGFMAGITLKGGDNDDGVIYSDPSYNAGGAGGGGYYGGGAGRPDTNFSPGPYGGGGGSGYINPQLVSNGSFGNSINTGGGTVTLSIV